MALRQVVSQELQRLGEHVSVALADQDNDRVRSLLDRIGADLQSHLEALGTS